jgi:hypothetical protein
MSRAELNRVVVAMSRRILPTVASGLLLLLLAGCQRAVASSPGSTGAQQECTPQQVHQVVDRFVDAFNRGDIAQLDQLVSSQQFSWYSTDALGERLNAAAYDRSNLMAYFAARHRRHERLALISLDVTYTNAREGGFWFRVTRSADDGLPPTRYSGKGGVQCTTMLTSLTVWSMDPLAWSPIELLPEAAALIVIAAGIGSFILWRRRKIPRSTRPASAPRR